MTRPPRTTCTFGDALDLALRQVGPLPYQDVALADALGLVAARDVVSAYDSPAFPQAAMDGFAVCSDDLAGANEDSAVVLPISQTIAAGQALLNGGTAGTCARIMTGANCPDPFDAVVPWEDVQVEGELVSFKLPVRAGQHIRAIGENLSAGEVLIREGDVLSAAQVGLAASNGMSRITVRPRPRIALMTIGDELIEPGGPLGASGIWNSNAVMVAALVQEFGGNLIALEQQPDNMGAVTKGFQRLANLHPDLILTVGGASSSERDVLGQIDESEYELRPLDVQMRPGRPLIVGTIAGVPMIGLPGNPGAAFNSSWQIVRPTIRLLAGHAGLLLPRITMVSAADIPDKTGRRSFVRVRVVAEAGRLIAHLAGSQSSASQISLAQTDGFLVIDESSTGVAVGDDVMVEVLNIEQIAADIAAALLPVNRRGLLAR